MDGVGGGSTGMVIRDDKGDVVAAWSVRPDTSCSLSGAGECFGMLNWSLGG